MTCNPPVTGCNNALPEVVIWGAGPVGRVGGLFGRMLRALGLGDDAARGTSSVHRTLSANATTKVPRAGLSAKEAAKDVPSWIKGERPLLGEKGRDFATRALDDKYGVGDYPRGPGSEFNKIQKWADRAFEDP
jgi:hypothetical protein